MSTRQYNVNIVVNQMVSANQYPLRQVDNNKSNVEARCLWLPPSALIDAFRAGLLRAVALRYRYCSGATYTVAVAVAPLFLVEKNGDGSAATFSPVFWRYALPLLLSTDN